jgi:signal recognition particle receptor subunit beta
MSTINVAAKEISLKIVYYGPGLCGKTTSLQKVHDSIPTELRPKMVSLATDEDRTLYFDFLPVAAYKLGAYLIRLQLFTVPGQVYYNSTRKLVLKGADGVVFVADSQRSMATGNRESILNLDENLREWGQSLDALPHVFQWNKRDLPDVLPVETLSQELNRLQAPAFETIAARGQGIQDALKAITRLVVIDLKRSGVGGDAGSPPVASSDEAARKSGSSPAPAAYPRKATQPPPPPAPPRTAPHTDPPLGISLAPLWNDPRVSLLALELEGLIRRGAFREAIFKAKEILTSGIAARGGKAGEEPLYLLLHGTSGPRVLRFSHLESKAHRGDPVTAQDALFALHLVTELALA